MRFHSMAHDHEWAWFKQKTHTIRCEDSQGLVVYNDKHEIQAMCVGQLHGRKLQCAFRYC